MLISIVAAAAVAMSGSPLPTQGSRHQAEIQVQRVAVVAPSEQQVSLPPLETAVAENEDAQDAPKWAQPLSCKQVGPRVTC